MSGFESNFSHEQAVSPYYRVLVLGNGLCGAIASKALSEVGLSCLYAKVTQLPEGIYERTADGAAGRVFASEPSHDGWTTIVLDEPPAVVRDGPFFKVERDGLADDIFGSVVFAFGCVMSDLSKKTALGVPLYDEAASFARGSRIGFVLDAGPLSNPDAGVSAVAAALTHQKAGGASYVFFRNMPVAVRDGELLYDRAKQAGVCFVRYEEGSQPMVERAGAGHDPDALVVRVVDSIAREPLEVTCDRVYAVGYPDPSAAPEAIKGVANQDVDRDGFLLSESIHCGCGQSFSRGVFAVGGCAGTLGLAQTVAQAYSVAVKARARALRASRAAAIERVSVSDECVRCLTCLRICPHSAISVNYGPSRSKITSLSASCEQCGLCISECPQEALDLVSFPQKGVEGFLADIRQGAAHGMCVVYGCERSVADLIPAIDMPQDTLFLGVPCAGRVSEAMLWATLTAGASGVLVVGCHPGNCGSRNGSQWAGNRVREVVRKLQESGITAPLASFATVSARQPARLETLIREFKRSLDRRRDDPPAHNEIGR
ncbi:MAG: hydrogenase iron-sulfur subunit [Desulfomonilaceae bacterium]